VVTWKCGLCYEPFQTAVTTSCGHSFAVRDILNTEFLLDTAKCILDVWEASGVTRSFGNIRLVIESLLWFIVSNM